MNLKFLNKETNREIQFIELWLQTYPKGMPDKSTYQPYMFFTCKDYTHEEIVQIMTKKIEQKIVLNEENGYVEVDITDLDKQLKKYEIGLFSSIERYIFDC